MKLTVLVDNNTNIEPYFLAELGLSFLIEDEDVKVLFDTGFSNIFIRNAQKMGHQLINLDFIALSHGHWDHTWGLEPLMKFYTEHQIEKTLFKRPTIIAHSQTFVSVSADWSNEIGSLMSENKLSKHFKLSLSESPQKLSDRLIFLGQIPRKNNFESLLPFGYKDGMDCKDDVPEDSALVYKSSRGLVIITGCSHSGICNIIEYAKNVCKEDRVIDIIGGLHLLEPSSKQLEGTLSYLKHLAPECVRACHCTDLQSKIALSNVVDLKEVGVGLTINYGK